MKCYYMLQNDRVTAFAVSELYRENQQGGGGEVVKSHPPPRLGLRYRLVAVINGFTQPRVRDPQSDKKN